MTHRRPSLPSGDTCFRRGNRFVTVLASGSHPDPDSACDLMIRRAGKTPVCRECLARLSRQFGRLCLKRHELVLLRSARQGKVREGQQIGEEKLYAAAGVCAGAGRQTCAGSFRRTGSRAAGTSRTYTSCLGDQKQLITPKTPRIRHAFALIRASTMRLLLRLHF